MDKPKPTRPSLDLRSSSAAVNRILQVHNTAPREGTVWNEGERHIDYYRKYVDVLADVSASTLDDIKDVLNTFVNAAFNSSETTLVMLKLFAGGEQPLLLTSSSIIECESCENGYSDNKTELLKIINTNVNDVWLQENWKDYDVQSSAVYHHITREAASLTLRLQSRESHIATSKNINKIPTRALRSRSLEEDGTGGKLFQRPIATTHTLVIFTDLDNSAETGTLETTIKMVDLAQHHTPGSIKLVLIEPSKDSGTQVYDRAIAAGVAFEKVSTVIHADNSKEMNAAFLKISSETSRKLNSFIEFKICTPERKGTHDLTVTYHGKSLNINISDPNHNNSTGIEIGSNTVTASYSADGFENTCGEDNSLVYSEETSFCSGIGRCGYVGHTVCPPCELPTTTTESSEFSFVEPYFSPVFNAKSCGKPGQRVYEIITKDNMKSAEQDETWQKWGSDLIVTAWIEKHNTLIRLGENFHGIEIREEILAQTTYPTDFTYKIFVSINNTALDNAQIRVMPGSPGSTGTIIINCIEGCDCDYVWYTHDYVLFLLGIFVLVIAFIKFKYGSIITNKISDLRSNSSK